MKSTLQHLLLLLKRLGLILVLYTLCRVVFLWANWPSFEQTDLLQAFRGGFKFDLAAIALINLPFILFSLVPGPWLSHDRYHKFLLILLALLNLPPLALNLLDVEYFKYTSKRSTADLFDFLSLSDDFSTLLPSFIRDYWYLFLLLAFMIGILVYLIKRVKAPQVPFSIAQLIWQSLGMIIVLGLAVLAFRGGTQLRPFDNANAMAFGRPQDAPLISNTPFSVIKTWGKERLEDKAYFSSADLDLIFNPTHHPLEGRVTRKKNVVIIIMESFSKEYVGQANAQGHAYTPFLDSISAVGVSFEHSYANGRKSIEALPSILSGIPAIMTRPFITSSYAGLPTDALPRLLAKDGYNSVFYHGGQTGTMGFDRYCLSAGFDRYVGREDYPDPRDYDNNWGIYDEPFFEFAAQELSQNESPYLATLFSLSSHHPYVIPEDDLYKYADFEHGLGQSVRYADDALRSFFRIMKQSDEFDNTLFVITADHIPMTTDPEYLTPLGLFSVPIIFYDPSEAFQSKNTVAQHIDIQLSIYDYLGLNEPIIGFGKSLVREQDNWAIGYLNEIYQYRFDDYLLRMDHKESINLFHVSDLGRTIEDSISTDMTTRLKAVVQSYSTRMNDNKLSLGQ